MSPSTGGLADRVEKTKYTDVDVQKGEYVSLARLWDNEGNTESGFISSREIAMKCLVMSGNWTRWNNMTERYEFLQLRQEHINDFRTCWQLFKKSISRSCDTGGTENGSSSSAMNARLAVPTIGQSGQRHAGAETECIPARPPTDDTWTFRMRPDYYSASPRLCSTDCAQPTDPWPAPQAATADQTRRVKVNAPLKILRGSPLEAAIKRARFMTMKYHNGTTTARTILHMCDGDPSWMWANTDSIKKPIIDALERVERRAATPFAQQMLVMEANDLVYLMGRGPLPPAPC